MRRLLLVLSTVAAACGSSDTPSRGGPLTGTVGGRPFVPADVRAVAMSTGATACVVPLGAPTRIGLGALALHVTSYPSACGDFSAGACPSGASAQSVTVLVARLNPVPPYAAPSIGAGTYTVVADPSAVGLPDTSGRLTIAYAQATAFDPSACPTTSGSVAGGTVRLDQVAGPVTGRVSLRFQDGSALAGDFSAPLCGGAAPDVCAVLTQAVATQAVPSFCALPASCP